MRESRRRLSTLLGNLPGMAYRCRNDRQWTMELVSEGCLGLTGFPAADVQGNRVVSYASLIHPDDQAMVWEEVQAAVRDGRLFQLTYRIATAQGDMRWVWEQGGAVGPAARRGRDPGRASSPTSATARRPRRICDRRAPGCSTSSKRSMTCWWSTTRTGDTST